MENGNGKGVRTTQLDARNGMKERQWMKMIMENGNGKGVRKGGEFFTKCTHSRDKAAMTLKGLLRLFLEAEAPRRQEALGKTQPSSLFSQKKSTYKLSS